MGNIFSRSKVINGILEITVNNYFEFLEFSFFFSEGLGTNYFRGQRDSNWGLTTTLDRFSSTLDHRVNPNSTYDTILKDFKMAIRGKGAISQHDDEVWALGQHYGLATPLLDWTSSLFIALFFAFEEKEVPVSGFRTVWGISSFVSERMKEYNKDKNCYTEFRFVDLITDSNNRLLSQSGLFTKQPINFNVRKWIEQEFIDESDRAIMFKINIPNTEREKILKHLFTMDIHSATIYPDLIGASKSCLSKLEMLSHSTSRISDIGLAKHASYS